MSHIKAMVVFQGATNIPEDRFINTFHFLSAEASLAAAASDIHPVLQAFYNGPAGTGSQLGSLMPAFVQRTASIRYYDMATAEPRVPDIRTFTIPAPLAGAPLPEECAVVCSFHGVPPVTPRKRGRVYLGPFTTNTGVTGTNLPFTVTPFVQGLVTERSEFLASSEVGWVVYSPTDDAFTPVRGGFCDNAFDTMRKRGPKATARSTWDMPVP